MRTVVRIVNNPPAGELVGHHVEDREIEASTAWSAPAVQRHDDVAGRACRSARRPPEVDVMA
jgi:hypothetical protein